MECGERNAQAEIQRKMQRIAPAYNKGPLSYMGDEVVAKQNLQGSMNAQGRSTASLHSTLPIATITSRVSCRDPKISNTPKRGRSIGVMWIDGDPVAIFDRNDPRINKATRKAFY